jgi:hypothetical protein
MFRSLISRFVGVSATAVLASAIIASSASAINITSEPLPCSPKAPRIVLTSTGQIRGSCFKPFDEAQIYFEDSALNINLWDNFVRVSADGTFTAPFAWPYHGYLNETVMIVADDLLPCPGEGDGLCYYGQSNWLTVNLGAVNQPVF